VAIGFTLLTGQETHLTFAAVMAHIFGEPHLISSTGNPHFVDSSQSFKMPRLSETFRVICGFRISPPE
jgi:hypothetical protein